MRTFNARRLALLLALLVAMPAVAAAAEGEMRWGLHVTLAPKWLDPAETEAFNTPFMVLYAVHDALSMGEAIQGYFQAVGIRTRQRTMERATYFSTWREKKLRGVILVVTATFGNAATRLEPYATKNGIYAYGSLPDIDDLYVRQGRELDSKKREALVHQIQKRIHDQVINIPIYDLAFIRGVGPRVEESGAGLIPGFAYSAPFEDLKLKK